MLNTLLCCRQKQPSRDGLGKRCPQNIQQIYRRTPMTNVISIKLLCNSTEVILGHGCSPVNLLYIFRIPFPKNTSGGLLLCKSYKYYSCCKQFTFHLH